MSTAARLGTPIRPYTGVPEMRLILCCARTRLEPEHVEEIKDLLAEEVDWEQVWSMSLRHKMVPLVWHHLKDFSGQIPLPVTARFRRAFVENVGTMLLLSAELLELTRLFAVSRIRVVTYKGPALGWYLYGNLTLRHGGDLDLLVRRRDVIQARELLLKRGYRPRHPLSPDGERFMLKSRYSEEFERSDGMTVELHWSFTNGDIDLPLNFEAVEKNLWVMPLGGGAVSMFGREDMILILAIHGSKHRWNRLEWLCGMAEAIKRPEPIDYSHLLDRATALGVRRMLLLALLLAADMLDAPVPPEIIAKARSDGTVVRLAEQVPFFMLDDSVLAETGSLPTDLFRFRLRERLVDRVRFLFYRLTTPSRPESWNAVTVGGHSVPLHGFLRPFRLLYKIVPAVRAYLSGRSPSGLKR